MIRNVASLILNAFGWKAVNPLPKDFKAGVVLLGKHTSLYDGLLCYLWILHHKKNTAVLIADKYFFWPMGPVLRSLGAIPVNRDKPGNLLKEVKDRVESADSLLIGICPEGTRAKVKRWKSGFYRLSRDTGLPIIPGVIDFKEKVIGPSGEEHHLHPSNNPSSDMQKIRDFYESVTPRHPSRVSPIKISLEEDRA